MSQPANNAPGTNQDQGQGAEELLPLVYEELRRLAAWHLANEKPGQTLQATALVHEAYLRLIGTEDPRWHDLQPVLKLSEVGVDGTEEHEDCPWFVMVRALAAYRAGRYEAAAEWLERSHPQTAVCLATIEPGC